MPKANACFGSPRSGRRRLAHGASHGYAAQTRTFRSPARGGIGMGADQSPSTLMSPLAGLENIQLEVRFPTAAAVGFKISPALRALRRLEERLERDNLTFL